MVSLKNPKKKPLEKKQPEKRQPAHGYHHGDLRNALMAVALEKVRTRRRADFTLRELATDLGVSHVAVYRHFKDKNALFIELAKRGFSAFALALEAANQQNEGDPARQLLAQGLAYVNFALKEPELYLCMFHSGISAYEPDAELLQVSQRAQQALKTMVDEGCRKKLFKPAPLVAAAFIWSSVHGLVMLHLEGQLAAMFGGSPPKDLVINCTHLILNGLTLETRIANAQGIPFP